MTATRRNRPTHRTSNRMKITWRYLVMSFCIVLGAAWIVRALFNTTVVNAQLWIDKANKELEHRDTIQPMRGDILADDGTLLATNLNYYNMRVDFKASKFSDEEFRASVDSLADTLAVRHGIRTADEWRQRLLAQLDKPRKSRSSSFLLLSNLSFAESEAVKSYPFFRRHSNANRNGLTRETVVRRCYPYGDMARRSIGRTSIHAHNEVHGLSGLEFALDSLLYGRPGLAKKVPLTHRIVNWTDVPAVPGHTLTTTIDIAVQDILENELNKMLAEGEADWGTAIIMEVATGDIKAVSNLERDSAGNYIESRNYCVERVEPGSVMKGISMVIALEDGFAPNLDQEYVIRPYVFYGGNPIKDTHSISPMPIRRFLEFSSNIGVSKLVGYHFTDDPNRFAERVRQLGMMDRFNTGIAGEQPSYFPHLDKKSGGLVSLGRQTYGYSEMISPLYVCAFYNAIANNGKFVRPRLVSKIRTERGDSVVPVSYVREQMCSPETARLMREMLHDVIHGNGGTATTLKNDIVDLAGKTGTARLPKDYTPEDKEKLRINPKDSTVKRPLGYQEGHFRLAFCGFFPYDNPKYTCMVLISNPKKVERKFRNAGCCSGQVLLNTALRMYARGMLGPAPDYRRPEASGTRPGLNATIDNTRNTQLLNAIGAKAYTQQPRPAATAAAHVPSVQDLSLREAIVVLEKAGYNVRFSGTGSVSAQTPPAGSPAQPGTTVTLTLNER